MILKFCHLSKFVFAIFSNLSLIFSQIKLVSMKLQASELPLAKSQTRRKPPKFIPILIAITFLFTIIPIYFPYFPNKLSNNIAYYNSKPLENTLIRSQDSNLQKVDVVRRWSNSSDGVDETAVNKNPPQSAAKIDSTSTEGLEAEQKTQESKTKISPKDSEENQNNSNNIDDYDDDRQKIRSKVLDDKKCDLFTGEWVPNPEGPYYTNETCYTIQEHQNCMKFGRPDTGFLKWRWKPDDCDLPIFDPHKFLELVKGKSIGFIGDSVARNHMQSLICLLSRVVRPLDVSKPTDENILYQYTEYNFNISIISSPYLVRTEKTAPNDFSRPFILHLDEFDENWTTKIATFDYLIISAGQWFFRPTYFYLNRTLTGCLYCSESNVTHLTSSFSYSRAFRTAFRAINGEVNFKGVTFLRTYVPSHFEGGPWDKGGDCVRARPFKRNETVFEDYSLEMYMIQLEELRIAQIEGMRTGGKFRLFDATQPMVLRPDGHPSKYGHWQGANQTFPNDCVHWCLPGPIDAWNDFLQELLKREMGNSNNDNNI